jgi:hypothetical protein
VTESDNEARARSSTTFQAGETVRRAAYRSVASTPAKTSTTQPSTSRAASTALGPSARKSRRSERTERRLSFRASLTRELPEVREGVEGVVRR